MTAARSGYEYELEFLYVMSRSVTDEGCRRMEALFSSVYPEFDTKRLEPAAPERETYYNIYDERLRGDVAACGGGDRVRVRVVRELRVKAMLAHLLDDARRQGSIRAVFDLLVERDDPSQPICATRPGEGLLVYRHLTASTEELEALEDSGVRFGLDFRARISVVHLQEKRLPALDGPYVLDWGRGRFVFRLMSVCKLP